MRTVKEHSERRNEILDCAETLFTSKGYAQATINDILEALNIAKGTFYHYFPSKEVLMDAVISRFIDTELVAAKIIADDSSLSAHEKMFRILTGSGRNNGHSMRLEIEARAVNNAEMHQKTMASIVLGLSPLLAEIVIQGTNEGTFKTQYPKECIEILLSASEFLLHGTVFQWSKAEILQKAKAISWTAEKILGVEEGKFRYLYARYENQLQAEKMH